MVVFWLFHLKMLSIEPLVSRDSNEIAIIDGMNYNMLLQMKAPWCIDH
jgi:hypothetical protein